MTKFLVVVFPANGHPEVAHLMCGCVQCNSDYNLLTREVLVGLD